MTKADLSDNYRDYIACLNKQDWPNLVGSFTKTCTAMVCGSSYRAIARCWREIIGRFQTSILISIYWCAIRLFLRAV